MVARVFGRLTVGAEIQSLRTAKHRFFRCLCVCGTHTVVSQNNLKTGQTQSCGCLKRERIAKALTTHGGCGTREYAIWCGIKTRCYNAGCVAYARYGGVGIVMCDSWRTSFGTFLNDMGRAPSSFHSIDRIDNDGPYAPWNCRWTTPRCQARNRRSNHVITHMGQTMSIAQWADHVGINARAIARRLGLGWSVDAALTAPIATHHIRQP